MRSIRLIVDLLAIFSAQAGRRKTDSAMLSKPQLLAVFLFFVTPIFSQGASYSNNIVSGFNLIANQLNGTNNLLDTVLYQAQDSDQLFKWNYPLQDFSQPDTYLGGFGWLDNMGFPSTTTLNPGEGGFYFSSVAYTMTVVGTQGTPNLPLPYKVGNNLVSRQIPGAGTFQNIMGFLPVNGCKFIRFNPVLQVYTTNVFDGTIWSGGAPSANIGEAVFVYLPPIPPEITRQPMSQSTTDGQPVTFSVMAVGPEPLSYQWYRDGIEILNATTNIYSIPSVTLADNNAGFSVVIGNTGGSVTSAVATLNVSADNTPPTVRKVTNTPDFMQIKIAFSERVNGSDANDTINYSIPGLSIVAAVLSPDGSNVTLTVTLTEGANYSLSIFDIHDLAANVLQPNPTTVMFQAAVPPMIIEPPQDQVVNPGDPATLAVSASGTAPLTYQWYKNNKLLSNETTAQIFFPSVQQSNVGSYYVVVANSAGAVTSAVARVGFLESYTLDLPAGYSTISRQLFAKPPPFPPAPDGTQLYVWRGALGQFESFTYNSSWSPTDPVLSPGEGAIIHLPTPALLTFSGLRIPPMLPSNAPANLSLISAPIPINAKYNDIIGSPPQEGQVLYRLRTNAPNALIVDDTNYRLSYFLNGAWHDALPPVATVGSAVWIGHVEPVVITSQPVGMTNISIGQSASFSVNATGGPPIHYQWLLNGTPIGGATNSLYTIPSVSPTNAGLYTVSVGNVLGDTFSQAVSLTLNVPGFNMTDNFSAQGIVTNSSRLLSSQNFNASREAGEPFHGGKKANRSVWLTWVPQANGIVTMTTIGSDFDTILAAYTGNSVGNLTLVDASDDDAFFGWSRISFNAVAGTSYRICVAGLGEERGDILLNWALEITSALLPVILAQPEDLSTGFGANATFSVTAVNGPLSYQWFRNGAPLAGATDSSLNINNTAFGDVGFYFVRVSNINRFRDSEVVSLQLEAPQPGEPFTGGRATGKLLDIGPPEGSGQPVKGPGPDKLIVGTVNRGYSGNTTAGCAYGRDANEPYPAGIPGSNTMWYAVRTETNGTMYVRTDGSTFNTVIAAYVGPGNNYVTLTNVASDNDSGLDGLDSRMSFPVSANRTNYIQVQGVGNASGTVVLNYWVVRPLSITNLLYTNGFGGRFTMTVNSTSNLLTAVQYATNFPSANWVTLTNYTPNYTGIFNFTNNNVGSSSNRYYRAIHTF